LERTIGSGSYPDSRPIQRSPWELTRDDCADFLRNRARDVLDRDGAVRALTIAGRCRAVSSTVENRERR
jgi:hypothetical protein